jgi:LEA14-like dessication related protein
MKAVKLLVLTSLALSSTACDELDPYLPTVSFNKFDVKEINFEEADVDFVFDVNNPNPVEISLSSFSYAFGLQEVDLLDGDDDDGMTLEAVGASELALPVHLTWQDAWDAVQATRGEDMIGFGLEGDFGFDTPVGEALLPYDEGGEFPAPRTPKFSFKKVRVTRLDVFTQTADIEVDLGVDNEHGSSLFFENFDYDLSLGGTRVAQGLIANLGEADGDAETGMSIPASIDLLNTGGAVWDALNGNGNLRVGLNATTDVDTPFGLLPLSLDESGDVEVVR